MYDNKIRLSHDVLEKAELIASEWGLKNARAAVEAVFRRYADAYLQGQLPQGNFPMMGMGSTPMMPSMMPSASQGAASRCEALDALDELLAL